MKEIKINIVGLIISKNIRSPVKKVKKQNINLVNLKILKRLYLSAITPPRILKRSTGVKVALATKPNIASESVRVLINHNLPYIRAHIPILEKKAAIQNNLYSFDMNSLING
tara:strand:+ start:13221 stop:13556 length:336 start_codon:yes stop_codon:yes gene_type:complete